MESIRSMIKSKYAPPQVLLDPREGDHEWEIKINPSWRKWAEDQADRQWNRFKRFGRWPEEVKSMNHGDWVRSYVEGSIDDHVHKWKNSTIHRIPSGLIDEGTNGTRYFLDELMADYARSKGADIMRTTPNPDPFKVSINDNMALLYDAATDKMYTGPEYSKYRQSKDSNI